MKFIVIDDELVSRKKMEKIMAGLGQCQAFDNGQAALEAFEQAWMNWAPIDLITLDISMPGLDGTEVLQRIRAKEKNIPESKRVRVIMVTSSKDKDSIMSSVQAGCDDYITKPFEKSIIIKKLEKFGLLHKADAQQPEAAEETNTAQAYAAETKTELAAALERSEPLIKTEPLKTRAGLIEEIITRFKTKEIELPAYSRIALKFREMVDKGTTIEELSEILRKDSAVTTKLISVSNSSYYRGMEENKTLEQAIKRLGLNTTSQYIDVICNRSHFAGSSKSYAKYMEKLWMHSLACANASQIVAKTLDYKLPEDPFLIGLLHDIGKLVLLKIFGELEKEKLIGEAVTETDYLETLDQLHTGFGDALLKRWAFSENFSQIVRYHDNLDQADPISKGLLVVHFSNLLLKSMGYTLSNPALIELEKAESTGFLKIDAEMLDGLKQQVTACMDSLQQVLI